MARRAQCRRVHSALAQEVSVIEETQLNGRAGVRIGASGQLLVKVRLGYPAISIVFTRSKMTFFSNEAPDVLFSLRMPMVKAFGLQGVRIGDDQATVLMPASSIYTNSRGDVHGGAFAVLMDCVLSCAARSHDPTRYGVITVDMSLHYVAGTRGDVVGTARCERRGKSLCFVRGEAHDADGNLLTLATGTFKLVERTPPT